MPQVPWNKNLATKSQILVEVAANQPNIQQRAIANKLDVTPQAADGKEKDRYIADV
jgi:predicted transcriptional regulator